MGTLVIPYVDRSEAHCVLRGDALGEWFHTLFRATLNEHSPKEPVNRKGNRAKPSKQGRSGYIRRTRLGSASDSQMNSLQKMANMMAPNSKQLFLQCLGEAPLVELNGNPSWFLVYTMVRQAVLEQQVKQAALIYEQSSSIMVRSATDSDDEQEQENRGKEQIKIPQIVGLGLCGVFELIKDTSHSHPSLCQRALLALLNMLQGQEPEALRKEPSNVIESLYSVLLQLSIKQPPINTELSALACACLLSLVISCSDTGKTLNAVAALLMSSSPVVTQTIQVPTILVELQKSVHSLLIAKALLPDWMTRGVQETCCTATMDFGGVCEEKDGDSGYSRMTCDGLHMYIHNNYGLHKIGTGYGGTIRGHLYELRTDFYDDKYGWLGYADGALYYRSSTTQDGAEEVKKINCHTLQEEASYTLDSTFKKPGALLMFSNGKDIGYISTSKEDQFVVRTFSPNKNPMTLVNEVPLKLARKCLDVFGWAAFEEESDKQKREVTGLEDDAVCIKAGKDFALLRTTSGKIMYTGKSQALGIKNPPAPASAAASNSGAASGNNASSNTMAAHNWYELLVPKSAKIVDMNVGHDGQHVVFLAEDGNVFFAGTAKKGEDGDTALSKQRRPAKAVKPRKMQRLSSKHVVQIACNNGTTAAITREGELFMYGKDTKCCDKNSGQVLGLKDVQVTQVALGKAHTVVISKLGDVYTFGINNRGQCGQDTDGGRQHKEVSSAVALADDEDEIDDDFICPPGKHRWRVNQCMVCTSCGGCTGYGNKCVNSNQQGREAGVECGCGIGPSGCADCGICRICSGEVEEDDILEPQGGAAVALMGGPEMGAQHMGRIQLDAADVRELAGFDDVLLQYDAADMFAPPHRQRLPHVWDEARNVAALPAASPQRAAVAGGGVIAGKQDNQLRYPKRLKWKVKNQVKGGGSSSSSGGGGFNGCGSEGSGCSDYEQNHSTLSGVSPGKVILPFHNIPAVQVAAGLQFTLVLLENGVVYGFGGNQYGQLGVGDCNSHPTPIRVLVEKEVKQIAAGSNHSVFLTFSGQVYTCGNYQKNQLGRNGGNVDKKHQWYAYPAAVPGIGAKSGRRATWIGASGDQTYIRIDESIINAHTLSKSHVFADNKCIGVIPRSDDICSSSGGSPNSCGTSMSCLMISTKDGSCKSYADTQISSTLHPHESLCVDPVYNQLWRYSPRSTSVKVYNALYTDMSHFKDMDPHLLSVMRPELMLPTYPHSNTTAEHCALHILGCLDTLTISHLQNLSVYEEEQDTQSRVKVYCKEDYSVVNRFESHGGGWGYSVHSVEAVRFMSDTDVLLGGYGLFGGRGEYLGKIKLYELGVYGGDNETDGELIAETDEIPYECGVREKHALLFDEPVRIQAGSWYVAMARISGPSSDCGSSGVITVNTEDQVVFKFKNSKKSNNGTDVNAGQIPQLLYRLPTCEVDVSNRKPENVQPAHILSRDFAMTVSSSCFEALLKLLVWSWNTFCATLEEVCQLQGLSDESHVLDLERLVYISTASLRLLRTYICELYPTQVSLSRTLAPESLQLADCVADARSLLWKILAQSHRHLSLCTISKPQESNSSSRDATSGSTSNAANDIRCSSATYRALAHQILAQCYDTFVSCFHAFYPTSELKWSCLCDLLKYIHPSSSEVESYSWLLAAVMQALCSPTVKLSMVIPNMCAIDEPQSPQCTVVSGGVASIVSASNTSSMTSVAGTSCTSGVGVTGGAGTIKRNLSSGNNLANLGNKSMSGKLDDNTGSLAQRRDSGQFPLLMSYMLQRAERGDPTGPTLYMPHCTFKEVLTKIVNIAVTPVKQKIQQDTVTYPALLVSKTCSFLSNIISELAASATGFQLDVQNSSRPLLSTPSRFTSTSHNAYWNTGNGSPDAVCFTVDRPGISIAGIGVYGGGAHYNTEVELLDDTENSSDPSHTVRWNSLEVVKQTFGPENCIKDVAEIKFDRAIPIKPGVKYAIRLRNRGPRTQNGDGGTAKIKGVDGTTFTFSACSLSSNGTNHSRGQIPTILYYSSPQELENHNESNKTVEQLARRTTITVASSIIKAAAKLLTDMLGLPGEVIADIVSSCHLFTELLPLLMAYISPVASIDPRGAVEVLSLVQDILSPVSDLNCKLATSSVHTRADPSVAAASSSLPSSTAPAPPTEPYNHGDTNNTTSQHYTIVESDHPYKPATVANYKVTFPSCVRWMAIEFDPHCGTAQLEDCLQLYIPPPDSYRELNEAGNGRPGAGGGAIAGTASGKGDTVTMTTDTEAKDLATNWLPVMKKFCGTNNWPTMTVILPGNVVCFSLETASDYVKNAKATFYGFKCTVIGYQWSVNVDESLVQLEREIAFLGGMCAASLMKKDLVLSNACPGKEEDETEDEMDVLDEEAHEVYHAHMGLLGKGIALTQAPTVHQALDNTLPYLWQSNEKAFLKDFVHCVPGTTGSRLAAWLQPEPYLDPKKCEVIYNKEDFKCGWPATIKILTRDQYGHLALVQGLKISVQAIPVSKDSSGPNDNSSSANHSTQSDNNSTENMTYGGHPPPNLDVPYQITSKDKKDHFHAICMMKAYEDYSFEELRYASPSVHQPIESMMIRCNNDGSYTANWTPCSTGVYSVQVYVDGVDSGEVHKIEVKDPPQGVVPPPQNVTKKAHQPNRMRKFIGKCSAGLRIRSHPTLQSEQLGVIAPQGIITFCDELHNDDGVWLRLNAESASKWCHHATLSSSTIGTPIEAWALQYNQHLGKTLLVPVDEPKSILDEVMKDTLHRRRMPAPSSAGGGVGGGLVQEGSSLLLGSGAGLTTAGKTEDAKYRGGDDAGTYVLVKCGASGHNIRSRPNMKATPIGMLSLHNRVDVIEELSNEDGHWVRLSVGCVSQYCYGAKSDGWCLCDSNDTVYLQLEHHVMEHQPTPPPSSSATHRPADNDSTTANHHQQHRGFDFTNAQLSVSSVPLFGAVHGKQAPYDADVAWPKWPTFCDDSASQPSGVEVLSGSTSLPQPPPTPVHRPKPNKYNPNHSPHIHQPRNHSGSSSHAPPPHNIHDQIQQLTRSTVSQATIKDYFQHVSNKTAMTEGQVDVSSSNTDTLSVSRGDSDVMTLNGCGLHNGSSDLTQDKESERGECAVQPSPPTTTTDSGAGNSSAAVSRSRSPRGYVMSSHRPDGHIAAGVDVLQEIPPELQGVSVKDLIKALGESRVNGNGVTPPRTPPTPRRTSRHSSPRSLPSGHSSLPSSPRCSPRGSLSAAATIPGSHTPSKTPPLMRRDLPTQRRDMSPSVSPRFTSPGRGSRSASSSPQRGGHTISKLSSTPISAADHKQPTFTLGPVTPKDTESLRLSPKSSRRDNRNRTHRAKRSASPNHYREKAPNKATTNKAPDGNSHKKLPVKPQQPVAKEPLVEAMSPSLAECLRAVFAAFIWHEGLVHDAMACASYLKFNPILTKEHHHDLQMPLGAAQMQDNLVGPMTDDEVFSDTVRHNMRRASEVKNVNEIPPQLYTMKERHHSDSRPRSRTVMSTMPVIADGKQTQEEQLPKTLQYLVYFWEKVAVSTRNIVLQNLTQPSPASNVQQTRQEKTKKQNDKTAASTAPTTPQKEAAASGAAKNKGKKPLPGGRGNMFGDAAAAGSGGAFQGASERETLCELCGFTYSHPVTYHMRQAHVGCGKHAGGLGYNSGGNFCGGWAGNCGDGGIGGSTWYLMCDACRNKYMKERRHSQKDHIATSGMSSGSSGRKKNRQHLSGGQQPLARQVPAHANLDPSCLEAHIIMKNNAMFLLDFASSSGGLGIPRKHVPCKRLWQSSSVTGSHGLKLDGNLPSVSEDITSEKCVFPQTPFLFLCQRGADRADSAFADEFVFSAESVTSSSSSSDTSAMSVSQPPHSISTQGSSGVGAGGAHRGGHDSGKVTRSGSMGTDHYSMFNPHASYGTANTPEAEGSLHVPRSGIFQRSISEIGTSHHSTGSVGTALGFGGAGLDRVAGEHGSGDRGSFSGGYSGATGDNESGENKVSPRRRNKSGDVSAESGLSLLKKPSAAMSKMIELCEQSANKERDAMVEQRVISFVVERHNLSRLQLSITQAIRKAACRVLAFQAFNWLLRNVTQPTSLHDLLWFMVSCLSPSSATDIPQANGANGVGGGAAGGGGGANGPGDGNAGNGDHSAPDDMPASPNNGTKDRKEHDLDQVSMCNHPVSDVELAGDAIHPLRETFHMFLQSVADVMMYVSPGSPLQQMAVRCWCLRFRSSDHIFLHRSHVFSNISKILSKSEEWSDANSVDGYSEQQSEDQVRVECLKDLTQDTVIKASSRPAMLASLTDNSTETFWESADEDRNKVKTLSITCSQHQQPKIVYVHVDNVRDLANKVCNMVFLAGPNADDLHKYKQCEVDTRHSGWLSCYLGASPPPASVIQLELKGGDATLRVRQIKVLGELTGESCVVSKRPPSATAIQQHDCETETLTVFRLLTKQVFGKLIVDGTAGSLSRSPVSTDHKMSVLRSPNASSVQDSLSGSVISNTDVLCSDTDTDLKEHMVSILFSRSKLSHLQKQVCAHIVQAIRKETHRLQDEWETSVQSGANAQETMSSDVYCFELLSMVLALSGSAVGCAYLSQQHSLIQDLLSLLHTGSPRVQRQVISLLRRVLPEIAPRTFASLMSVTHLPPKEFSILPASSATTTTSSSTATKPGSATTALSSSATSSATSATFDPDRPCIFDVFLACIAKSLSIQTKVKGYGAGKSMSSFVLNDCLHETSERWWLQGSGSSKLATDIIALLKDMASGALSSVWTAIAKGAIAESILAFTKLETEYRQPEKCVHTPTLWLGLASLCVLDKDHVDRLSSGQWMPGTDQSKPKPTCDNHDDGETLAIILCSVCGNLCADCDRFLHLHRRTNTHQRQVFKEEEESIKVDLHEGCGRMKLFWLMALVDAKTLKAMVEFREGSKGKLSGGHMTGSAGVCRFCGASDNTGILAIGNVCAEPECQAYAETACTRTLPCGHACGGILQEEQCLPCLHGCQPLPIGDNATIMADQHNGDPHPTVMTQSLKQDAEDMCMICFTEALSAAPAIQLQCGHVFHYHCCKLVLEKRWNGPRITFSFAQCPICKKDIEHAALTLLLEPIRTLYSDVRRKALMRMEYEGHDPASDDSDDASAYAMQKYAYYVCYRCNKAYYGGEVRCEEQAAGGENYDPQELVCGGCSDVARAQMCPKHGADFLEYKCRYCCSVAVFFCFGTTHFCNACHDDFQRVTNISKDDLPHCPAGPKAKQLDGEECPLHVKHPATGEEYALGCGVCRNANTF